MSNRVLIGSLPLRHQPGRFRDILLEAGLEPVDPPAREDQSELSAAYLAEVLPSCFGFVAGAEKIDEPLMQRCPLLKIIARTGVGYDVIDIPAAQKLGIRVSITPGVNQESVAEQAFGLLLGLTRRIAVNSSLIAQGQWERTLPVPIRGKTIGLIGLGRIGQAMVPRAKAFGMNLLAYDPYLKNSPFGTDVPLASLAELFANSDIISLHIPVTSETIGLVRAETIQLMKKGVIIINTARGGLIHEPDLIDALNSGHITAAGLDVTNPEPPQPDNPLRRLPNVLISPHLAGIDTKSMADMADLAAWCVAEMKAGRLPQHCLVC